MKIKTLIPAVAIIALFVFFVSSCNSNETAPTEESTTDTATLEQKVEAAPEAKTFVFTPSKVEILPQEINNDIITWGEGSMKTKGYSFSLNIFLFDSTGERHDCSLYACWLKDEKDYGGDDPKSTQQKEKEYFNIIKKAYAELLSAKVENLVVTCDNEGRIEKIEKINKSEENTKKVGEIYVRSKTPSEIIYPIRNY